MITRIGLLCVSVICALYITYTNAQPKFDCTNDLKALVTPDRKSNCHYYFCTARRVWSHRRCENGGSVPKRYRKRFKNSTTRMNLCRKYDPKCRQSAAEFKQVTTRQPFTPSSIECIEVQGRGCKSEGQCCDGLGGTNLLCLQSTCCVPEAGQCVEDEDCCRGGDLKCINGRCITRDCEYPVPPENGRIDAGSAPNQEGRFKSGEIVRFSCNDCYTLSKNSDGIVDKDVQCQPDGEVDDPVPTCEKLQCTDLEAPENARRRPRNGNNECGDEVVVECEDGFEPEGPITISCEQRGTVSLWDRDPQTCSKTQPECQNVTEQCGNELQCCQRIDEIMTCSFTGTCCRERSQKCNANNDCCRGLTCSTETRRCEPPISIVCDDPIDIVFAVDTSCSIAAIDKDRIRTFMTEMARAFDLSPSIEDGGVLMGALTFNEGYKSVAQLQDSTDPPSLISKIETMNLTEVGCRTHTFAALEAMENEFFQPKNGDRGRARNKVIVLSDGVTKPSSKEQETFDNADSLRATGAEIIVVGLPQGCPPDKPKCTPKVIGQEEWLKISGADEDPNLLLNILNSDFTKLRETVENIGRKVCGPDSVTIN